MIRETKIRVQGTNGRLYHSKAFGLYWAVSHKVFLTCHAHGCICSVESSRLHCNDGLDWDESEAEEVIRIWAKAVAVERGRRQ